MFQITVQIDSNLDAAFISFVSNKLSNFIYIDEKKFYAITDTSVKSKNVLYQFSTSSKGALISIESKVSDFQKNYKCQIFYCLNACKVLD